MDADGRYIKRGWVGGGSEPLLGQCLKANPSTHPPSFFFWCMWWVLVGVRRSMGRTPKSRSPQRIAHFIPLLGNGMPFLLEPPFGINHDDEGWGHHMTTTVEGTAFGEAWQVEGHKNCHFSKCPKTAFLNHFERILGHFIFLLKIT